VHPGAQAGGGEGYYVNAPSAPAGDTREDATLTLLCVDDETNILNALRRLLRPHGYRVLTAPSGAEGLEVIAATTVDLVLSDMRMPHMDGAQFLEQVKARSPDTARILLTGYADLASTVSAINKAEIYRYISKPWDDAVVLGVVRDALERKRLGREKARLERLTAQQNEALRTLNETLEEKVQARTAELADALASLEAAHDKLKKSFVTSVKVFSNLIELREGATSGHSRRVADLARRIALRLGLGGEELQDVTLAGLLHGIGELGLPETILRKRLNALDPDERAAVMKHPLKAQWALMALEQLHGAATLIRNYRERYDGMGYPDRLSGLDIPVGSRILAVAHDYETALDGVLTGTAVSRVQARALLIDASEKHYDPAVVDALVAVLDVAGVVPVMERGLEPDALEPGMVLTRDLVAADGTLLVSRDHPLSASLIEQVRRYDNRADSRIRVYVRVRGADGR
jgi:response regulator RpfG family c-di-GMP phosphodiesterase